jgi:hypothetical protein
MNKTNQLNQINPENRVRRSRGWLFVALEQVGELGEGRKGRRSILLPARRRLTRRVSHLIPLVLIVVAVETEQLPVAPVGRIVVVVVVLVMDRELAQLLAVKFASAVRTDPGKHFERLFSIGLLQLSLGAPCHASLAEDGDLLFSFNQRNETNQITACGAGGLFQHPAK